MQSSTGRLKDELVKVVFASLENRNDSAAFAHLGQQIEQLEPAQAVDASTNPTVDRWLESAVAASPEHLSELANLLLAATSELPWLRSYENLPSSPERDAFQQHYSFELFAGPTFRGNEPPFAHDDLLVGFTLQAPNITYPPHHHEAPEIYGVISGELQWQVGDQWRKAGPGDVIVHRPHESHSMVTGDQPVLTWVAWPHSPHCKVHMPSLDGPGAVPPTIY